jgi:hypothetical protein
MPSESLPLNVVVVIDQPPLEGKEHLGKGLNHLVIAVYWTCESEQDRPIGFSGRPMESAVAMVQKKSYSSRDLFF